MGTGSKIALFLLITSELLGSVIGDALVYSDGMVKNNTAYALYNLTFTIKRPTGLEKQFIPILLPGNSAVAPSEPFTVTYQYLNPTTNKYTMASQEITVEKKSLLTKSDYVIDTSASYWYNNETYILIVQTKEKTNIEVLTTISQPVEQEETISNEKETIGQSTRVKKIHIVSDMVCIGQTIKHSTNRAIFFLKPRMRQPFYTVFVRIGKGLLAEVITINIEGKI